MSSTVLATLALCIPSPQDAAADWPQFLGPNRTGHVAASGLDLEWADGEPEIAWRVEIGPGYGGAAVRDGEVFLLDREVGVMDLLRVFDLESGEEKWKEGYAAEGRLSFAGSRTVPTVTDQYVYTTGGFGQVTCFDREGHDVVWQHDVAEVYGGQLPMFGWSAAPLVYDGMLIHTPLGEEVGLVAFDAESGDELWYAPTVGYSHSTPTLLTLHGRPQIVFLSTMYQTSGQDQAAPLTVSSFDPGNGELLWRDETELSRLPIPGPVQIDDERFFITGGYRGGSTMLKLVQSDDGFALEELFHIDRGAQIHTPLLHDGHLYLLVNENWNNQRNRQKEGGLLCLSLAGEEVWRTADNPFFGRGNAILLGEHLLIQDGFNGVLRVAKATATAYETLAEANLFEIDDRRDHQMWAPMAFAGGRLLMRSQDELICVRL